MTGRLHMRQEPTWPLFVFSLMFGYEWHCWTTESRGSLHRDVLNIGKNISRYFFATYLVFSLYFYDTAMSNEQFIQIFSGFLFVLLCICIHNTSFCSLFHLPSGKPFHHLRL